MRTRLARGSCISAVIVLRSFANWVSSYATRVMTHALHRGGCPALRRALLVTRLRDCPFRFMPSNAKILYNPCAQGIKRRWT